METNEIKTGDKVVKLGGAEGRVGEIILILAPDYNPEAKLRVRVRWIGSIIGKTFTRTRAIRTWVAPSDLTAYRGPAI